MVDCLEALVGLRCAEVGLLDIADDGLLFGRLLSLSDSLALSGRTTFVVLRLGLPIFFLPSSSESDEDDSSSTLHTLRYECENSF